ncbi:MAG: uridine diphosphate-N-acetylglucosamine-binding protein YvcK [Promicromonosporaceae bacterium]|nr:uridine diphosphate-N-acetylglucosamine-binding protein YvcK [Promicromonosporaceae bacterium]
MPLPSSNPAVVALGGGHGLSATLRALRHVSDRLTAIVTVADDGGSSGRLRAELGGLPPGDLRMALAALTDDSEWGRLWAAVLQHRFHTAGPLDNHALGNLLIAAVWELISDPVAGLDWVGKLLGARGRVLPLSTAPLVVKADVVKDGERRHVAGQVNVALAEGRIERLWLDPANPPACAEAVTAIEEADWVVLGPGSWYTSVLVHLLVPQIRDALLDTKARRCVALNLGVETETSGLTAVDHLLALHQHAPELRVDVVVADPSAIEDIDEAQRATAIMGAKLVMRQVALGDGTARHDSLRLAAAYRDVFASVLGDVR